jgi:hypothetical protein
MRRDLDGAVCGFNRKVGQIKAVLDAANSVGEGKPQVL